MSAECSDQDEEVHGEFKYRVLLEHAGTRLDHYLVLQRPSMSRSQLSSLIKNGTVTVNSEVVKASRRLRACDTVCGSIPEAAPIEVVPQKIEFDVLYEDEHLLLISKPPNVVVHPGSGNPDKTLVNGLVHHSQNIAAVGDSVRPGIVHRLDKDTSGIMVVAKNNVAHRLLVDAFKERRVKKTYYALVFGLMKEPQGRICAPIGRHPVNRKKMAVNEINGKFAASNWCVERTYQNRYSLVKITIETGRTHQIRVHMASLGHPVAGDSLYSSGKTDSLFPRQMLHSSELSFAHPVNEKKMKVTAPFWPDMASVLRSIEKSGEEM